MAQDLRIDFKLEHKAFDKAVQRFIIQYKGGAENAIRRVGFELERRTSIRTTRVDTGRMKNGWHISFHRRSNWSPPEDDPLQKHPDPGNPKGMRTLFLQNRVFYTQIHEFGSKRGLSPLLMLTKSLMELRGELEKFLKEGMKPLWNKEINGITGRGLSAAAIVQKEEILSRLAQRVKGKAKRERGRIKKERIARGAAKIKRRAAAERALGIKAGKQALARERASRTRASRTAATSRRRAAAERAFGIKAGREALARERAARRRRKKRK